MSLYCLNILLSPGDRFNIKQIRRLICRKKNEIGSHLCTREELEKGLETRGKYIDLVQYKQNKNIDCSAFNQLPRCSNIVNSERYDPELIKKHVQNALSNFNKEFDLDNLTDLPEDVYDPFVEGPIRDVSNGTNVLHYLPLNLFCSNIKVNLNEKHMGQFPSNATCIPTHLRHK